MTDQGTVRPLPPSLFARIATAARYAITGVAPESTPAATTGDIVAWFGMILGPPIPAPFKAGC